MHLFSRLGSMTRRACWASASTPIAAQTTRQSVVAYATNRATTSARATSFGRATRPTPAPSFRASSTNESKFANHRERERAEPLYQEALDVYEKAYGREHRDVATVLYNLGRLYHAQGLYAKAEPLDQEALAIDTKELPPNHPSIATDFNLGVHYFAHEQWQNPEQIHLKTLEIRKRWLPVAHPKAAMSLYNLRTVCEVQREFAKAEPLLRRVLEILQQTLPPDSPTLGKARKKHAEIVKMLDKHRNTRCKKAIGMDAVATSRRCQ